PSRSFPASTFISGKTSTKMSVGIPGQAKADPVTVYVTVAIVLPVLVKRSEIYLLEPFDAPITVGGADTVQEKSVSGSISDSSSISTWSPEHMVASSGKTSGPRQQLVTALELLYSSPAQAFGSLAPSQQPVCSSPKVNI